MMRVPAFALVLVAACFNPTFHNPTCGPNGECPSGSVCVDGTCRAPDSTDDAAVDDAALDDSQQVMVDAMPDSPTPPLCLGSGAWQMCGDSSALKDPVTLSGSFNTDTSPTCTTMVTFTSATQPNVCVVAGSSITISATLTATGLRPLVLFSAGTITQASGAILDVASHRAAGLGAGRHPAACKPFVQIPGDNTVGAGGAAAGSFMTKGGNGGVSGKGNVGGIAAEADTAAPTVLRGGCRGEQGGSAATGSAGVFGNGGGAVYLVAKTSISLAGSINASGSAGGGAGVAAGGGGGGTGGMIVFNAPAISSSGAKLMATGGAGGGGGGAQPGQPGNDPNIGSPGAAAQGGSGGSGNGCGTNGRGGNGSTGAIAATDGEQGSLASECGGAGAGGGAGYIRSNIAISGITSAPAISIVP